MSSIAGHSGVSHHYAFVHRLLPRTLFDNPEWCFTTLQQDGEHLLGWLWDRTPQDVDGVVQPVPSQGLDLHTECIEVGEDMVVLWIPMPEPQVPAEAHHVAITRYRVPAEANMPGVFAYRYLTLEKRDDLGLEPSPPRPVLCEWVQTGRHLYLGDLCPPDDVMGFLTAAARRARMPDEACLA